MRCPVPYALVALFGWGLIDWVAESVRRLAGRWPHRPPAAERARDAASGAYIV
jgi:hypothetical protein